MFLRTLRVGGLRGAESVDLTDLGPRVTLPKGPTGVAVADALDLFVSALDAAALRRTWERLGIAADAIDVREEEGFPVQASWPDASAVPSLLAADGGRQVTVGVEIGLDPLLFGQLREVSVRDPRLVLALGDDGTVTMKVGVLFTKDWTAASLSVLQVTVGSESFAPRGADRPVWLPRLLTTIAGRFWRVDWRATADAVAGRLLASSLGNDPVARERARRAARAVSEPPFSYGALDWIVADGRSSAVFGPGLVRARQFGPSAAEALRLVEAVLCQQPDVLVVEAPGALQADPAAIGEWLEQATNGPQATLEQVFLVPGGP